MLSNLLIYRLLILNSIGLAALAWAWSEGFVGMVFAAALGLSLAGDVALLEDLAPGIDDQGRPNDPVKTAQDRIGLKRERMGNLFYGLTTKLNDAYEEAIAAGKANCTFKEWGRTLSQA